MNETITSKEPELFTISEAVSHTDIPEYLIHYWQVELELPLSSDANGLPLFSKDDLKLLVCIRKLLHADVPINTIKGLLPDLLRAKTMTKLKEQLSCLRRDFS